MADLPGLDCWIEAALGEEGWTAAVDISAAMLGAQSVALGLAPKPGVEGELCGNADATPAFLGACRALLSNYSAQEVQTRETGEGLLAWAHAPTNAQRRVQDVAVFAQWTGPSNLALLRRIAIVAARAVSARREIAEMRAVLALRGAAFDQLPFGVAVVDSALYLREPNAACRQILARADGLSLHQDRLICRAAADDRAIAELVTRTIAGRGDGGSAVIRVERARGAEPYVVAPVFGPMRDVNIDHCLLVIIDPETQSVFAGQGSRALLELNVRGLVLDAEGLRTRHRSPPEL